jgi:hypothetical protein
MTRRTVQVPTGAAFVLEHAGSGSALAPAGPRASRRVSRAAQAVDCVSGHRHGVEHPVGRRDIADREGILDVSDAEHAYFAQRKMLHRSESRRQPRLTTRGRLVLMIALLSVVSALMIAGAWRATAAPAGPPAGWSQVIVQPGDSLWSLAVAGSDTAADPRATMALIRSVNQVPGSTLRAGDRLWVPSQQR